MKNSYLLLLCALLLGLYCCEKTEHDAVEYCVEFVSYDPNARLISANDLSEIHSLFKSNNLDYENLQFFEYKIDKDGVKHIFAHQFANGLKVFYGSGGYHFNKSNVFLFEAGNNYKGQVNLDTKPRQKMNKIAALLAKEIQNDSFIVNSNGVDYLLNGCFECEFGYYNLNSGQSYSSPKFAKVWYVHPKGSEYPYAYVNDDDATLIHYFNGIIVN